MFAKKTDVRDQLFPAKSNNYSRTPIIWVRLGFDWHRSDYLCDQTMYVGLKSARQTAFGWPPQRTGNPIASARGMRQGRVRAGGKVPLLLLQ